jgi:ABC-2 type transport system ATP-binding protein
VLTSMKVRPDAQDAAPDRDLVTGMLHDGVPPEALVSALVAADVRVRGFDVVGETLEQRFVELTGEGFDVVA